MKHKAVILSILLCTALLFNGCNTIPEDTQFPDNRETESNGNVETTPNEENKTLEKIIEDNKAAITEEIYSIIREAEKVRYDIREPELEIVSITEDRADCIFWSDWEWSRKAEEDPMILGMHEAMEALSDAQEIEYANDIIQGWIPEIESWYITDRIEQRIVIKQNNDSWTLYYPHVENGEETLFDLAEYAAEHWTEDSEARKQGGADIINDAIKLYREMEKTEANNNEKNSSLAEDPFYGNRASAARLLKVGDVIYYSNVYDDLKLYRYDISTYENVCLVDDLFRVQYISLVDNTLYFSAISYEYPEYYNVYSLTEDSKPLLLIDHASAPLLYEGYIYYFDYTDEFQQGVFRKEITSGITQELIGRSYNCSDMALNVVDNKVFAHNLGDILVYDLSTGTLENITKGKYTNGINKLQLYGQYLYFYTYGETSAIIRMNIATYEEQTVLEFNEGNFWYDVMIASNDYVFFTGRQNNAKKEGEEFVSGSYVYSLETQEVSRIFDSSGPTCYLYNNIAYCLRSQVDTGSNDMIVFDLKGNILHRGKGSI